MILFFASDLLWATKIKSTADALGIAARPVRSVEMLEARLGDSAVRALLVDLDAPEVAMALIRVVRGPGVAEERKGIRVVAFGPHVAVEAFAAAKAAGADTVLARGALHNRLPEVLQGLSDQGIAKSVVDDLAD